MKTILTSLLILIAASYTEAQCIDFTNQTIETCAGIPVTFDGTSLATSGTIQELADFNSGSLPTGWSTSGGTTYSQPCGNGIDNTPYFWASTSGGGAPFIQSNTYDFTSGGYVTFDFVYAIQGGGAPCEGPDFENEGMSVLYSTDGGSTWVEFIYYSPEGFELPSNPGTTASAASGVTPYTSWNSIVLDIPAAAETSNTMLRWEQFNSSGTCCDNWGVDNISVFGNTTGVNYLWSTGATTLPLTTSSTVDSTFYISVFDGMNNLICEDSVSLEVYDQGFDNGIQIISQSFVQGQPTNFFIDAYNEGCPPQTGQIVLKLDPLLTFNNSSPPPSIITQDSIIYDYNDLYLNAPHEVITVNVTTSASAVVGDSLEISTNISPVAGDLNPENNFKDYRFPVEASFSANDKKVYPSGDCDVGYIPNDQLVTYTVRFQNTGTTEVVNVQINDLLNNYLDPSTLRVVATSHDMEVDWISPNLVAFEFDSIMLPTQTQNEVTSNGYVVFEIEQVQGLSHGDSFTNEVDITFDNSPATTTNQVVSTVTDGSHYVVGDTLFVNAQSAYNWNGQLLTSSGAYTQVFPLPDGCDSTAILYLTLDSDVGLSPLSNNPFEIYPNPADEQLMVSGSQEGVLRLISSAGKTLLVRPLSGNDTVSIKSMAAGLYIVEIQSGNRVYREQVVIQ